MVTDHNLIFSDSSLNNEVINESVKHALIKDICRRMTPQPLKIRADMELTCFSSDGIECIKDAMRAAESSSTKECKVKVSLIASPLYVVTTQTLDKESGMATIEAAIHEATVRQHICKRQFFMIKQEFYARAIIMLLTKSLLEIEILIYCAVKKAL